MGANNIVITLQQAIKATPNRRENYGPAMKLKLGQPLVISGHGDHIHFAINGLKIYSALKYKMQPFTRKKSVASLVEFLKNKTH